MADKIIVSKSKVTNLFDSIRAKSGSTDLMSFDVAKESVDNLKTGGGEESNDMLQQYIDGQKSMRHLFYSYEGEDLNFIKNLDFKTYTDAYYMFSGLTKATTIPMINTSNIVNMANMFSSSKKLTTIPSIDTTNAENMKSMFYYCQELISVPELKTVRVTNMNSMFSNCSILETVEGLNMLNVENTSSMFTYCYKLKNLKLTNIRYNLQVGSGASWGSLLTIDSLIGLCKECIKQSSSRTLTMGNENLEKLSNVYVKPATDDKFTIAVGEKGEVVVCESTDDGAMTIMAYMTLKNWTLV